MARRNCSDGELGLDSGQDCESLIQYSSGLQNIFGPDCRAVARFDALGNAREIVLEQNQIAGPKGLLHLEAVAVVNINVQPARQDGDQGRFSGRRSMISACRSSRASSGTASIENESLFRSAS